jgi:hypothetical protein
MATFGASGQPSQNTINYDSVFATSLAAYRKELVDQIGASNPLLKEIMNSNFYESQDGGTNIQEPLMYALQTADTYDGYDELPSIPVNGITDSVWEWSQCAAALVYSMKEMKMNKQRIVNLIKSRIMQSEMGLQELFSQMIMWGAGGQGGAITSAYTSGINGSAGVNPLPMLIMYDPTTSVSIGNINQSTYTWWRNKKIESAATTYSGLLLEVTRLINRCSLGSGGRTKLIITDETSFELFQHALFQQVRYTDSKVDEAFPFENVVWKGVRFVMEDKTPDAYSGTIPTLVAGSGDPTSLTYGSMYAVNPKFFKLRYESDSDFKMLSDDGGKTIFKPINGDSRLGHYAWMGNMTVSRRNKQGVLGKIARTLTA